MKDNLPLQGEAQIYIEAPPENVYEIISDVTRVAEWSPECRRCEWLDGATGPAVGVRFRGRNRRGWIRWTMPCRITDVESGTLFAFETAPPFPFKNRGPQTRWRYRLEPANGGTLLTESFEVLWYTSFITQVFFGGRASRLAQLEESVRGSLARIKVVAEG